MTYKTAHAENQSLAHQAGLINNKADLLSGGRVLKCPSTHGVPEKGQAPKVFLKI